MVTGKTADVIVVGAGNAALCAALSAREDGCEVLALEKAPQHARGGNTYFTGGAIRFAYRGIDDVRELVPDLSPAELDVIEVGQYTEAQYFDDLMRVTEGLSEQEMASALTRGSFPAMRWMYEQGVRFVPSWSHQAFKVDGKFRFWGGLCLEAVGGGKGLSDQLFDIAEKKEIGLRYATAAVRLPYGRRGRCVRRAGQGAGRVRGPCVARRRAGVRRLRGEPRDAGPLPSAPDGSSRRCAAFGSTRATASVWRSTSERSRSATGAGATRWPGTSTRRPSATGRSPTCTRSTPTPSGSS